LCRETLGRYHDYLPFKRWFEAFVSKDDNARRAVEKIMGTSVKSCQSNPDDNLRPKWERLGF
jgi:hypothetical protein